MICGENLNTEQRALKERYELEREEILVNYSAVKKRDSLLSLTADYNRSLELASGNYNIRMQELYDKFKALNGMRILLLS